MLVDVHRIDLPPVTWKNVITYSASGRITNLTPNVITYSASGRRQPQIAARCEIALFLSLLFLARHILKPLYKYSHSTTNTSLA
jgi:hypothetical protein